MNMMVFMLVVLLGIGLGAGWQRTSYAADYKVDGISGASFMMPMPPRDPALVREHITDWLQTHWFMSLATADEEGTPYVSGVTFYVEDLVVYFRTDANSTKAVNIRSNPRVSFTIWDPVDDMAMLKALQVMGRARILEGEERDRIATIFDDAPGTASNLKAFFEKQGIKKSYRGRAFGADQVVVDIYPEIARFSDNTTMMGHSDVYRFNQDSEIIGTEPEKE
jgi:uncharacterized protein YhbP (UPF0306 family)